MPMKPCAYRGCPVLLPLGGATRCPEHEREQGRQRDRNEPAQAAYRRAKWRHRRARELKAEPLCLNCAFDGRTTAASMRDHVRAHGGDLRELHHGLCASLCASCHAKKEQAVRGASVAFDLPRYLAAAEARQTGASVLASRATQGRRNDEDNVTTVRPSNAAIVARRVAARYGETV